MKICGIYIQISYVILDSMCDWGGGGEGKNPIDGELLPYGILPFKEIHGGIPCDTGFNSPTEKVAENIVIWEILDWVHII